MSFRFSSFFILVAALLFVAIIPGAALARDAAFLDPNAAGGAGEEAVKVDPKAEIDIGETALAVAKRTSVFFSNQTNIPVKIEKIATNSDSDVTAEITANDCMKQGLIAPMSRCSLEVSVTPTAPGAWSVDILMTHNGAGRITRARLTGKTSGSASNENKEAGLAVNTKEAKPVDFGDIDVGDGKIVRSTLMVNDSPEPITIYSIDVIEADNGLQRLDQGCAVDMELVPGASCPVTLVWEPKTSGPVSTDLIIRHSGKLGFAVIPIRGTAKSASAPAAAGAKAAEGGKKDAVPPPPSAQDLEKEMAGKVAPVPTAALAPAVSSKPGGDGALHLIGTVGDRAVILKPDGETDVVAMGSAFDVDGKTAKLVAINVRSADVMIDGKKKTLSLEAASSLVDKANEQAHMSASQQQQQKSSPAFTTMGGGLK